MLIKRILPFTLLILLVSSSSIGAHLFLKATKIATAACFIGGTYSYAKAAGDNTEYFLPKDNVCVFIRNALEHHGIDNATDFPLVKLYGDDVSLPRAVCLSSAQCAVIEKHLENQDSESSREITHVIKALLDEVKHYENLDDERIQNASLAIPAFLQYVGVNATAVLNEVFDTQPPKCMKEALPRAAWNVALLPVKVALALIGIGLYSRELQRDADVFSGDHAQSREELDEWYRDALRTKKTRLEEMIDLYENPFRQRNSSSEIVGKEVLKWVATHDEGE